MKKYLITGAAGLFLYACQSNKEEAVEDICRTTNVTYSGTVASIITSNGCLNCHNSTTLAGGFRLENYDQVKAKASESRSGNAVLYGAVAHVNGFSPMPKGMPQISACDQAKMKAWIEAGMPQ